MKKPRLIHIKAFGAFEKGQGRKTLAELCAELFLEQKKTWQDLQQGCESLEYTRVREILCKGFSVNVQYNPRRIRSSLAHTGGRGSIERPCFLCQKHLPADQKGILYGTEYIILCNPAPIFPFHFTICHREHLPQAIDEHIHTFLQLTIDLGEGWMVLYNGPQCGASAPDHLHFQAVPSGKMPIEKEIGRGDKLNRITQLNGVQLSRARGIGREVMILDGDEQASLANVFKKLLTALKTVIRADEGALEGVNVEPMINIIGFPFEGRQRLLVFPRAKHRPEVFFMEGDERIVVSPAIMEMGGVLITPLERDFERIDAALVDGIFREVSVDSKIMDSVVDAMAGM